MPLAVRYSKEEGFDIEGDKPFVLGKWKVLENSGQKNLYIAAGSMLKEILNIKDILKEKRFGRNNSECCFNQTYGYRIYK